MQRTIGRPSFRLNLCLEYLDELHPLIKTLEKNNSRRIPVWPHKFISLLARNQKGRGGEAYIDSQEVVMQRWKASLPV
jgi:hypothetical protein